ncbi:MAG: alpha/beta fold hydrolase [Betaproteobacteria bacterium]|nr:alpha/beta fold hydrolase [Betaproteobacteria bacterium]
MNLFHALALRAATLLTLALAAILTVVALHSNRAIAQAPIDQDVSLATQTGTLYGSELVPKLPGKIPVVLLHAGSGPTDRNGNSAGQPGGNNSLKLLAEGLAREGIATLRFDKRGVGQSRAAILAEKDLRFEDYVNDAAAWVKKLKADPRFSKVIVAGHSEGSLIGMLAAKQAGADGFISIAGVARSIDEVLRDQLKPRLPADLYARADKLLQSLKNGEAVTETPPALAFLFRPSVQPYLISWLKYTPTEIIGGLTMPILILQGDADTQVAVAEATALGRANPRAEAIVIAGMNHVLKTVAKDDVGQSRAYADAAIPLAEPLTAAISAFVKKLK